MPVFPTLASGAIVQFPFEKALVWRSVRTVSPGGATAVRNDAAWRYIEWWLSFRELSQAEAGAIEQLYLQSQGGLKEFTFVDPAANLLDDPGDLTAARWQASGVTVSASSEPSPADGAAVFALVASGGSGSLCQTIPELPELTLCFSVYVRASPGSLVRLRAGAEERQFTLGHSWRRCWLSTRNERPQGSLDAGILIPSNGALLVSAPQLEAQPAPGPYKPEGPVPAVYPNTRFAAIPLRITATGPDRYAAQFQLVTHI